MEVTSFNFLYMLEMLVPAIRTLYTIEKKKTWHGKSDGNHNCGYLSAWCLTHFLHKILRDGNAAGDFVWVESVILMFVWFVLIWAILIFSIYFCTESSIYEAMYIFALSAGVEHILYCIRVLVEHFTGGIIGNKHPLVYIPCLAGSFLLAYYWLCKRNRV